MSQSSEFFPVESTYFYVFQLQAKISKFFLISEYDLWLNLHPDIKILREESNLYGECVNLNKIYLMM